MIKWQEILALIYDVYLYLNDPMYLISLAVIKSLVTEVSYVQINVNINNIQMEG
jgi:hypothetical protein